MKVSLIEEKCIFLSILSILRAKIWRDNIWYKKNLFGRFKGQTSDYQTIALGKVCCCQISQIKWNNKNNQASSLLPVIFGTVACNRFLYNFFFSKCLQKVFSLSLFAFFYEGLLSQALTIHETAGKGRRLSSLNHFHPLTDVQTFIYNFSSEMTTLYI